MPRLARLVIASLLATACAVEELDPRMPPPPEDAEVRVLLFVTGTAEADAFFTPSYGLPVTAGRLAPPEITGWRPIPSGETSGYLSLAGRSLARADHGLKEGRRYTFVVAGDATGEEEEAPVAQWIEENLDPPGEDTTLVRLMLSPGLEVERATIAGEDVPLRTTGIAGGLAEAASGEGDVVIELDGAVWRFEGVPLPSAGLLTVLVMPDPAPELVVVDDLSSTVLLRIAAEID